MAQRWVTFWTALGSLAAVAGVIVAILALKLSNDGHVTQPNAQITQPNAVAPTTAAAAPSLNTTPRRIVSSIRCRMAIGHLTVCESSDPTVEIDAVMFIDATGCTLDFAFDWADNTAIEHVTVRGGPAGRVFAGRHTFAVAGSYQIRAIVTVTAGPCGPVDGQYQFIYTPA